MADERTKSESVGPRGRGATSPRQIPRKGWGDVLKRTKAEFAEDDVGLVSAGVAFYLFLAIFPALAALVSIYGLVADPAQVQSQVEGLSMLPTQVRDVLGRQLELQAGRPDSTLGWTLAISLVFTCWSASKGMTALMKAMNVAYDEREDRGFLRKIVVALAFTGGAVVLAILVVVAIAGVPMFFGSLGLGTAGRWAASIVSWLVVLAFVGVGVATMYRWGPSRANARWRWVTPGAVTATLAWAVASALFSLYVAKFGSYGETYGSLAAVVILLLWLWITAMSVVTGAELNAEIENQTTRDPTTGRPEPRGRREVYVADTVGREN